MCRFGKLRFIIQQSGMLHRWWDWSSRRASTKRHGLIMILTHIEYHWMFIWFFRAVFLTPSRSRFIGLNDPLIFLRMRLGTVVALQGLKGCDGLWVTSLDTGRVWLHTWVLAEPTDINHWTSIDQFYIVIESLLITHEWIVLQLMGTVNCRTDVASFAIIKGSANKTVCVSCFLRVKTHSRHDPHAQNNVAIEDWGQVALD